MTEEARHFETELAVIGSGIAGFAASIFALNKNITTAQVGNTGAVAYTTGYLDLLGKIEGETGAVENPWESVKTLKNNCPNHPLSDISTNDIEEAFIQFTTFLGECGIAYSSPGKTNITALSPAGTLKKTLCLPSTMAPGPKAFAAQKPCVIVDFKGLKGFSGRQVVANLQDKWPNLRTERISFPDMTSGEIYPEVMARALEVEQTREKLAEAIKVVAEAVKVIGLPAVLGMHSPDFVRAELERLTGLEIFEIPTMPPSVPGIRLREMFEQVFPQKGLTLIPQQKVQSLTFKDNEVVLHIRDNYGPITIHAKAVILATGRFLSGGLEAHITGISEALLDLPVTQPEKREDWYLNQYTDVRGHAIHKAGIEVDSSFRPLGKDGKPYHQRLFGAGIILAHQDWIRSRSGAGIAIATAYKAVEAVDNFLHA
ncbi:glycerol-3-phosphate dehydrogenase subunit GlpB [Desulforhopalus sp. IMCC35007]|uniref:glycerol-3-phosphate dehydrogenase subunit GlpB n=1 Tax=Desulforhopalus sp. IMCC35007 TaxID=2569543 RepID=UPI0010AEA9AB|nr:glycerol-3-phosphate dehydrogenase subunit GlpB [Desulforhopalus sp. IMCC35007]TKB11841.1 anaerobic glycerol-3-phosphate dehydrogenase subunit B [Desulforhopalus sp. IMCC35007]